MVTETKTPAKDEAGIRTKRASKTKRRVRIRFLLPIRPWLGNLSRPDRCQGDVGTKSLPWNGNWLWRIQTQVAGECCRARNVVILSRCADASDTEGHTRGYVSNERTRAGHAFP